MRNRLHSLQRKVTHKSAALVKKTAEQSSVVVYKRQSYCYDASLSLVSVFTAVAAGIHPEDK
jgi:hypothetical protein